MSVPAPPGVNSSSSSAFRTRPSRIMEAPTPALTASRAVLTLGIMPPNIVPSSINSSTFIKQEIGKRRTSPRIKTTWTCTSRFQSSNQEVQGRSSDIPNISKMGNTMAAVSPSVHTPTKTRREIRGARIRVCAKFAEVPCSRFEVSVGHEGREKRKALSYNTQNVGSAVLAIKHLIIFLATSLAPPHTFTESICCSSSFSLFNTPATSVNSNSRCAFNAPAMAPAAVSALQLYVCPDSSTPIGAMTGTIPDPIKSLMTCSCRKFRPRELFAAIKTSKNAGYQSKDRDYVPQSAVIPAID